MGLALAVVFLPLYLIMSIVAIRLARASKADRAEGRGYELLGMALATVMTWGLVYLARPIGYEDYGALLWEIGIILAGPLLTAFCVSLVGSYLRAPWLARSTSIAAGAMYATVTMPWATYLVLALIDWATSPTYT